MKKVDIGIVNVTGYAGMELVRLLEKHPGVRVGWVTGRSAAGRRLSDFLPFPTGLDLEITQEPDSCKLAFLALPHRESARPGAELLERGIKVVDLGADFRLKDIRMYAEWYDFDHPYPDFALESVYGLPELYREPLRKARLVANPGCYPTAAILALAPAVRAGIVGPDIIIDAKSGVSGAGRTLGLGSHFAEADENILPYALDGHRHLPEIKQELDLIAGRTLKITFVPHLVPAIRGIEASCYGNLTRELTWTELDRIYTDFYVNEPFVKITSSPPGTKMTTGSNYCLIHPRLDARNGRLVVISVLDNLVKGAAGQAIQNMNLVLGFDERLGLDLAPLYP